eukprot:gene6836-9358_t
MLELRERVLVIFPIVLVIAVIVVLSSNSNYIQDNPSIPNKDHTQSMQSSLTANKYGSTDCTSCPFSSTTACTSTSYPVMSGLDFVNYFTKYKLSKGKYNESETGVVGSSKYQVSYNGYAFYFESEENMLLFEAKPSLYVPQYGGFCSWGMTSEYCPEYAWSGDCLGPAGNAPYWTIQNEKLYFFLNDTPKGKFMDTNIPDTIENGDKRWYSWFSDKANSVYFTKCKT